MASKRAIAVPLVNNLNQKTNNHPPVIIIKMIPANDNPRP